MGERLLAVGLLIGVLLLGFVPAVIAAVRHGARTFREDWDRRDEWSRSKGPNL